MKTLKLTLVMVASVIMLASCSDSKKSMVQEKVDSYATYVDSVSQVGAYEAISNWEAIEKDYKEMKEEANNSVVTVKDNSEMQKSIDESTLKYETFKAEVMVEHERMEAANSKMMMRQSLLGSGYTGGDMKFTWINKDNILSVYQNFARPTPG